MREGLKTILLLGYLQTYGYSDTIRPFKRGKIKRVLLRTRLVAAARKRTLTGPKQYWNNGKNDMSLFSVINQETPYEQLLQNRGS